MTTTVLEIPNTLGQAKQEKIEIYGGNNQIGNNNIQRNVTIVNGTLPDSLNFLLKFDTVRMYAKFSPREGIWSSPFVLYPKSFFDRNTESGLNFCDKSSDVIFNSQKGPITVLVDNKNVVLTLMSRSQALCDKSNQVCVNYSNLNSFFCFGNDLADESHLNWYVYMNGQVYYYKYFFERKDLYKKIFSWL